MIIDAGSKKDKKGLEVASYLNIEYRKSRLNGDFYLALSDCSKSTIKKPATCQFRIWWGRLGSNQRPSGYEPPALTPELRPQGSFILP